MKLGRILLTFSFGIHHKICSGERGFPNLKGERRTALYVINPKNAKRNQPHASTQVFKCHLHVNPWKNRPSALFTDTRTFTCLKRMDTTDKRCPIKRTDHSDSTLSFIWYYLSWCQDCGVFRVLERPWQARWLCITCWTHARAIGKIRKKTYLPLLTYWLSALDQVH